MNSYVFPFREEKLVRLWVAVVQICTDRGQQRRQIEATTISKCRRVICSMSAKRGQGVWTHGFLPGQLLEIARLTIVDWRSWIWHERLPAKLRLPLRRDKRHTQRLNARALATYARATVILLLY
jgi:hypothetical protein